MELFVDICSFFGAWFLVAGPIYQASVELRNEDIEVERIHEASNQIKTPRHVSNWWWLIPPVRVFLQARRNKAYRLEYFRVLSNKDVEDFITFTNKATGWLLVASGASLIAIKETYELIDEIEWSLNWFWILLGVMAILSIGYTVMRTVREKHIVDLTKN